MKESEEEFKMFELMLEDSKTWARAEPTRKLRYFIEELMRRKNATLLGCAKALFKFHESLKAKNTSDITDFTWNTVRTHIFYTLCDHVPSRHDLGHERVPNPYEASSFTEWAREIKDLISVEIVSWHNLVREFNQNPLYFDFRARFSANKCDFKQLYELCMELDSRKKMNPVTLVQTNKVPLTCHFCGKLGHIESKCFKKNNPVNAKQLNDSIYSVKNENVGTKLKEYDYRNVKLFITNEIGIEAMLDSGSDCNFLKYGDMIVLLGAKVPINISPVDRTFFDARGRTLCHCSYAAEIGINRGENNLGSHLFLIPDEQDWKLNLLGKDVWYKFMNMPMQEKDKETLHIINYVKGPNSQIKEDTMKENIKTMTLAEVCGQVMMGSTLKEKPWHAEINTLPGESVTVYRKLDDKRKEIAMETLKPLMERDYVSKVTEYSTWLNPVMLVPKAGGKYRFCLDLRALNKLVKQDSYPIPSIMNITDCLSNKKIFSKLDIKDGFFHIPLRQEDKIKTSFKIGPSTYQFNVLPMGFKNAPNIFQRIMEHVLSDYLEKICIVYIDDILIFSEDEESHLEHLNLVYKRISEYGFVVNDDKVELFKKEISFLGYIISFNKIKIDLVRTQGIQDFPVPKTVKEVRRFIGMIGYERRFLANISAILRPLYELTAKDARFKWTEAHQIAFEKAKECLRNAVELTIADPKKRFTLETDASATGMGAILSQEGSPIVFFSGTFCPNQQKYSITERELLAALWGMEKCKNYLYGREFDLITDHKAIEMYHEKDDFGNARIQRWYERLRVFNFVPIYRAGGEMASVDALSRSLVSEENLTVLRIENPDINERVMEVHESLGHRKTIAKDLKALDIPVSNGQLEKILSECIICKEMDQKYTHSNRYIETKSPGEIVGVDVMFYQNHCVFVAIDYFSRKVFTKSYRRKTADNALSFLKKVHDKFKFEKIISDCGKEFKNRKLHDWEISMKIKHHFRPAYYHKGSGRVERAIRTLRNSLNKTKGMLKVKLETITQAYNKTFHRAIKMSPEEAIEPINRAEVLINIEAYKKEFIFKELPKFLVNQRVMIKNEFPKSKEEKKFNLQGEILECLERDTYLIELESKERVIKHYAQLKLSPGML